MMTIIKNFEQFVNENLVAANQVFEDHEAPSAHLSNATVEALYDQWKTTPQAKEFRKFTELAAKAKNTDGTGRVNIDEDRDHADILFALLKHGQATKKGFLGIGKVDDDQLAKKSFEALNSGKLALKFEQATTDYNPTDASGNTAKTAGKVTAQGTTIDTQSKFAQTTSGVTLMCRFVNNYNTKAFREGQGQFVLSQRMDENGYLDLVSAPDVVGNTLYLYTPRLGAAVTAGKEVETSTAQVGGESGVDGKFAAEFDAGSDKINAKVQAEVAKAVELVMAQFPAGKRPDKFSLTSGASTEWNGKNYPSKSGVGKVPAITNDETKNQDLAYRRGVSFMTALNAGLKAKGHPGFDNFEVSWAIGKSGQQANPADRFVDLELKKNAVAPKAVEKTTMTPTSTGANKQNLTSKAQLFELKLSLVDTTAAE